MMDKEGSVIGDVMKLLKELSADDLSKRIGELEGELEQLKILYRSARAKECAIIKRDKARDRHKEFDKENP